MSQEQQDTYQSWMERVAGGRDARPLSEGERVTAPAPEPFAVIEMFRTTRPKYIGEVGKKEGSFIFHFFPLDEETGFPPGFADKMGDAFLEIFKFEDRVKASYMDDLTSWAVIAQGFANNPLSDQLAIKIFTVLDQKLE